MDYETLITLFIIFIFPIAFFVFIAIIKLGLKKQCGGGKALVSGFLIFFFLSLSTLIIIDGIMYPPINISWIYIEFPLGGGMVGLLAFAILYIIGKPIFDRIKKKTIKTGKDKTKELTDPLKVKTG